MSTLLTPAQHFVAREAEGRAIDTPILGYYADSDGYGSREPIYAEPLPLDAAMREYEALAVEALMSETSPIL